MVKILASGAESIVYLTEQNNINKDRIVKSYRIPEIDQSLRISRTKKESKVLIKLHKLGQNVPRIIKQGETNIEMEFIDGIQLKKILDKRPELAVSIGEALTKMHENDIIHGDLTTSNMILKTDTIKIKSKFTPEKLYFIDFGLSFSSKRVEDKAVDIHLFKQALESKHFRSFDKAYANFLKSYNPTNKKLILERLQEVEKRGRYKEKI